MTIINNPSLDINAKVIQAFPVPSAAGNLITLVDRCWCCEDIFPKYGGGVSRLVQEFHHPVPRAFGGRDGPTVSLCSGHHASVHKVADCLLSVKDFSLHLDYNPSVSARIVLLAKIAADSERRFRSDPNRRMNVSTSLPSHLNEKLKLAAKANGLSVSSYVERLILADIDRQFPRKRG